MRLTRSETYETYEKARRLKPPVSIPQGPKDRGAKRTGALGPNAARARSLSPSPLPLPSLSPLSPLSLPSLSLPASLSPFFSSLFHPNRWDARAGAACRGACAAACHTRASPRPRRPWTIAMDRSTGGTTQ